MLVWPTIRAMLEKGTSPSARDTQMVDILNAWLNRGASRLDGDQDGKIDDPGAAVMDAAWPYLADAVMSPRLGPLTDGLVDLIPRSENPSSHGSSFDSGWYGYVKDDLSASTPFYCGGGVQSACVSSLWAAIDKAGDQLQAAQGPGTPPPGGRCDGRADPIRPGPAGQDDALDEPADLPAGHQLLPPSSALVRLAVMPEKRYLMTPVLWPAPPQVLAALSAPVIHHRARDYRESFQALLHRLGEVFQTRNDVLVYTCSGTGGMESAIATVCSPGERVLVVSAGYFGERFGEIARAYACDVLELRYEWGETPSADDLRERLDETGATVVLMTQSETSTGVVADVQALSAASGDALVVCDAIRAWARSRSRPTPGTSTLSSPARRKRS